MQKNALVRAAKRKGFVERYPPASKHEVYTYVHSGAEVGAVMLTLSRSHTDLSQAMVASLRRELHFDNKRQFESYVECTFTKEDYETLLRGKGLLHI